MFKYITYKSENCKERERVGALNGREIFNLYEMLSNFLAWKTHRSFNYNGLQLSKYSVTIHFMWGVNTYWKPIFMDQIMGTASLLHICDQGSIFLVSS
jgi:hypothetical protein